MQSSRIEITSTNQLEVKIIWDILNHVTTARVRSFDEFGNTIVVANGKARWNPIDYYSEELGRQIALGRAFEKFGRKTARIAQKLACSPGEWRARLRRDAETWEIGTVISKNPTLQAILGNAPQQPRKAKSGQKEEKINTDPTSYIGPTMEEAKERAKNLPETEEYKEYPTGAWNPNEAKDLKTLIEENQAQGQDRESYSDTQDRKSYTVDPNLESEGKKGRRR